MPEPITTLGGAALVAYLSKEGVSKLLGPTAEYLGGEMKELVEKSQRNIASVFRKAERKCGDRLEKEGAVNPRVMKHVFDEARFSENELLAEYFGGVLASARTEDGKDDRGVYYSQIVQSLSVYQLRAHYLFYYLIWKNCNGQELDLNDYKNRNKITLILPTQCYSATFSVYDPRKEMPIIAHTLAGLAKADLIGHEFELSDPQGLEKRGIKVAQHSFIIEPTITGLELFVWAHGQGENGLDSFLSKDLAREPDLKIKFGELARLKGG